jgi:hypothetical protein
MKADKKTKIKPKNSTPTKAKYISSWFTLIKQKNHFDVTEEELSSMKTYNFFKNKFYIKIGITSWFERLKF